MKGQESIMAIILILMIVIALAALAYTWFSGIFSDLTGIATTSITKTSSSMATQFSIESAIYSISKDYLYVTVRNIGTQSFDATKTLFFVRESPGSTIDITCTCPSCSSMGQSCIANFNVSSASSTFGVTPISGDSVKASISTGLTNSKAITIVP
jgi:hypothetical protein